MPPASPPRVKPRLRGVSHEVAFYAALVAGALLVLFAPGGRATVAAGVYSGSLAALFGVSALYHRVTWQPAARQRMRRLDHAAIFVLIAGTYTPICLLVLGPDRGAWMLAAVWCGAAAGTLQAVLWIGAPRALSVSVYVALASVVLADWPALSSGLGTTGVALLAAGCGCYVAGGVVYAARRPDPLPAVFGYHEIFHALVVAAAVCHFAVIRGVVMGS